MGGVLVVGDLHCDLWEKAGRGHPLKGHYLEHLDAVIIAGDLCDNALEHAPRFLEPIRSAMRPDARLMIIPGNHESYHNRLDHLNRLQGVVEAVGCEWVQRQEIELKGHRLLMCTLWAGYFGASYSSKLQCRYEMRDFHDVRIKIIRAEDDERIPDEEHGVVYQAEIADYARLHAEDLAWLTERLESPSDLPTLVITHHAPTERILPLHLANDPLKYAYANRLDDLIERTQPQAWLFGHVHSQAETEIGQTVVRNISLGYPWQVQERRWRLRWNEVDLDAGDYRMPTRPDDQS